MLIGYLISLLKGDSWSSKAVRTSCCTILTMIMAVIFMIIGKCFLAFALFEALREFCDLSIVASCCVTAAAFITLGMVTLIVLNYTRKSKSSGNIIVDKYDESKRVVSAFLNGLTSK